MMTILSIINVLVTYLFQVNFYIGITTPINTVIIIILINDVDTDDDDDDGVIDNERFHRNVIMVLNCF